jgi:hypothetical protein
MAQRQAEAAKKANGHADPEAMAKLAADAALTAQKLRGKAVADSQTQEQKQKAFIADEKRKDIAARSEIARGDAKTAATLKTDTMLGVVEASRAAQEEKEKPNED